MQRLLVALAIALALGLFAPRSARAYSVGGAFTTSCHERITVHAMSYLLPYIDNLNLPLPDNDDWEKVAAQLVQAFSDAPVSRDPAQPPPNVATLSKAQLFFLYSLAVGVRAPDTGGRSAADLNSLRRVQANPAPVAQYVHALRAAKDDGLAGEVTAVDSIQEEVRSTFAGIRDAIRANPGASVIKVPFYLDYYGNVDVDVSRGPYLLGFALHTIQDSYSHMLRNADGSVVLSVLNYEEAIAGALDERRDGIAHSAALDDCTGDVGPLVSRAEAASVMVAAALRTYVDGDETLLDAGLSPCQSGQTSCGWMTYNPPCRADLGAGNPQPASCCTLDNDYCGTPWLPVARRDPAHPYLRCSPTGGLPRGVDGAGSALVIAFAGLVRRIRRRAAIAAAVAFEIASTTRAAHAEDPPATQVRTPEEQHPIFLGLEAHGAFLSDAPERSMLNVGFGYALRGGYRFAQRRGVHWGLLAHVEASHWVATELISGIDPGVFDVGVGGEVIYAKHFVRSSVVAGTSTLLFDAAFDKAGTTGIFVDVRPAGLRYRLGNELLIAFDPISLTLVEPTLGPSPAIRDLQYRTLIGIEWVLGTR